MAKHISTCNYESHYFHTQTSGGYMEPAFKNNQDNVIVISIDQSISNLFPKTNSTNSIYHDNDDVLSPIY